MNLGSKVSKENIGLIVVTLVSFLVAGHFDVLEEFIEFSEAHEDWELDELLTTSFAVMIYLAIVLYSKTKQLHKEIAERIQTQEQVTRLATLDPLTDLPNRREFLPHLEQAIKKADIDNDLQALLFIDIDDFKRINDNYGHAVGDELLVDIARVLQSSIRRTDKICRIAGDEFIVHLPNLGTQEEVALVADKILAGVSVLREGSITLSIGIAMIPWDAKTSVELIANADHAMYQAKEAGKNRYCFYSEPSLRVLSG